MEDVVEFLREREVRGFQRRIVANFSDKIPFNNAKLLKPASPAPSRSVFLLKVNCDDTVIAAAHMEGVVILYDVPSGECIGQCEGHEKPPWTINFHPSIPYLLASGCLGGRVCLWSIAKKSSVASECDKVFKPRSTYHRLGAIASLSFHPYRSILAVAWAQEIAFLDYKGGRVLSVWRFACDGSGVRWVHFNPDGWILYTASSNARHFGSNCLQLSPIPIPRASSPLGETSGISPSKILRGELVRFLLGQPAEWYESLGICHTCSLRLCLWAAGLAADASFPHRKSPPPEDVDRTLINVALTVPNGSSRAEEVMALRCKDPSPNAVVVIEDFPSNEWFLSKGLWNLYCSAAQPSIMCCPGHIHDLFLTHRDLVRYSLCRRCLQKFWQWANDSNRVQWFTWTRANPTPDKSRRCVSPRVPGAEVVRPSGVCYQCCQYSNRNPMYANAASVMNDSSAFNLLESQLITSVIRASVVSSASHHFDTNFTAETIGCKRKHPERHNYSENNTFSGVGNCPDLDHLLKRPLIRNLSSDFARSSEHNQLRSSGDGGFCWC